MVYCIFVNRVRPSLGYLGKERKGKERKGKGKEGKGRDGKGRDGMGREGMGRNEGHSMERKAPSRN